MRSKNFSGAPRMAQATAQFVGVSAFFSPWGMIRFSLHWLPVARRLKQDPGYCGMRTWYEFPFALGQVIFFTDNEALRRFGSDRLHVDAMVWLKKSGVEKKGWIRLYEAAPGGYTSGEWHTPRATGVAPSHAIPTPESGPVAGPREPAGEPVRGGSANGA